MASEYIALVKRPYTTIEPVKINLKTDADFDGTGTLTRNRDIIDLSLAPGGQSCSSTARTTSSMAPSSRPASTSTPSPSNRARP
jgi:hypothetical protein